MASHSQECAGAFYPAASAIAGPSVSLIRCFCGRYYWDPGKDGALAGADREDQEISMLALHLLQSALVHVNTVLIQRVLEEQAWSSKLTEEDRRGLSPLFWTHVNPYGKFSLDMEKHLDLAPRGQGAAPA